MARIRAIIDHNDFSSVVPSHTQRNLLFGGYQTRRRFIAQKNTHIGLLVTTEQAMGLLQDRLLRLAYQTFSRQAVQLAFYYHHET